MQPALTRALLLETEERIGFKLPQELVALLAEQNGGYIRWQLEDMVHDTIHGIGPHFPEFGVVSGSEKRDLDWSVYGDWLPFDVKDGRYLVPFDGDGHWSLCLDYRRDSLKPGVTFVDTEGIKEEPVADSFAAYLQALKPEVYEDEFVLQGVTDIEALRAYLGTRLGMDASQAPKGVTGCLVYGLGGERRFTGKQMDPLMAVLLNEGRRLWLQNDDQVRIQLSANRVPRGYVPDNATCRPELQLLLSGTTKHYPGVAEDAWIMCATDTIIPEVIAAVVEFGIKCTPLDPGQAFGSSDGTPH